MAPIHPGFESRAQRLLHSVHALDELREVAVAQRMGSCDIARVAREFGPGVDEQRASGGRGCSFQHLIVQHGAAFVQRDDRVVRQLLLTQSAGTQESELDVELGAAVLECSQRGPVTEYAETAGFPQALDLIRQLGGARIVQSPHERRRIDGAQPPSGQLGKHVADVGRATQIRWQHATRG